MVENPNCPLDYHEVRAMAKSCVLNAECDECRLGCLLRCLVMGQCAALGIPVQYHESGHRIAKKLELMGSRRLVLAMENGKPVIKEEDTQ